MSQHTRNEAIDRHADLAQAQNQVQEWNALRYLDALHQSYREEDKFRHRSEGQKLRRERERRST
jgi:hypothetical protein